jgi:hypothetical protein
MAITEWSIASIGTDRLAVIEHVPVLEVGEGRGLLKPGAAAMAKQCQV